MGTVGLMKRIGTHSGNFHADEALACFFLTQIPQFKQAQILRSREESVLSTCDVVVDVGGVYDPSRLRFDHHQRGFGETLGSLTGLSFHTKLSSAGLVYAHFGKDLIKNLLQEPDLESSTVDILFEKLYEKFVEEIDAVDNGVAPTEEKPKYAVTSTLSSRVGYLNPPWNQPHKDIDAAFQQAMELTGLEFTDRLLFFRRSWLPARELVHQAIITRYQTDPSGKLLCLESGGLPWKQHFFDLEGELVTDGVSPVFVLFSDESGSWRVLSIPEGPLTPFQNRSPLPVSWRGLRDVVLSETSGIPDCVFVHASGFIGGNKTREGAFEMARKSLEMADSC